jgi:hypothetical protein
VTPTCARPPTPQSDEYSLAAPGHTSRSLCLCSAPDLPSYLFGEPPAHAVVAARVAQVGGIGGVQARHNEGGRVRNDKVRTVRHGGRQGRAGQHTCQRVALPLKACTAARREEGP